MVARISRIKCERCGQIRDVHLSFDDPLPEFCENCQMEVAKAKKEKELATFQQLPLEERVRRLEKEVYELRAILSSCSEPLGPIG